MANPRKRVPENVPGDFFVDATCIDCDACRQIAPSVFGEAADTSFVKAQPVSSADRRRALQAILACPTGSIGCDGEDDPKAVMKDFPLLIEQPVYTCGFNSPKSYGGNSYFIKDSAGNWLIDSPRFVTPLVRQLEALGGITHLFLPHQDDVERLIQKAIRDFMDHPFQLDDGVFRIAAKVGVALFPNDGVDADGLFGNADRARELNFGDVEAVETGDISLISGRNRFLRP